MTKYEQRRLEFIGQRFGRLVVKEYRGSRHRQLEYLCECDCGVLFLATKNHIGVCTNSCGCLKREISRARMLRHGLKNTVEYQTWCWVLARCRNPNVKCFKRYGGRGIKVCTRWERSFEAFLEDMGQRPSPKHSIERRNNNGDYEPQNCYWATRSEQDQNKRNNVKIQYQGLNLTATVWAQLLGANSSSLRYRKHKGWPDQSVIETPIKGREADWQSCLEEACRRQRCTK